MSCDQPPVSLIAQLWVRIPFKPEFFFRLSFRNWISCVVTARIFLLFDLSSAVQNTCFIYLHLFIHPSRVYYELAIWLVPSWLDSSVGRALHRHRRGQAWVRIPFKPEFFFRLSFRNCLSCAVTTRIFHLVKIILRTLHFPIQLLPKWHVLPFSFQRLDQGLCFPL